VLRLIEDNWLGGQRIGQGSFDSIASSIAQMFDFSNQNSKLILDPSTGQPVPQGDGEDDQGQNQNSQGDN
jgi:phospholipase C